MFGDTTTKVRVHDALELFFAQREAQGLQPVTIENYRYVLGRFASYPFVPESLAALTEDHVTIWLATLRREGLSDGTVHYHQKHLNVFLRWAYQRGHLQRDLPPLVPLVKVRERRRRTLKEDGFSRLLTVASHRPGRHNVEHRLRNVALLHLLWSTGVRRTELSHVNLEDVDLRKGTMIIRHAKNGRPRVVPFDKNTKVALLEYVMAERGEEPGGLFLARSGQPLTARGMGKTLEQLARRAGIQSSSHDFRRGFAARMRKNGLDIAHTMRLLGHSTPQMTLVYSEEGEEEAAINAYRQITA